MIQEQQSLADRRKKQEEEDAVKEAAVGDHMSCAACIPLYLSTSLLTIPLSPRTGTSEQEQRLSDLHFVSNQVRRDLLLTCLLRMASGSHRACTPDDVTVDFTPSSSAHHRSRTTSRS
jgi:hypothetical protein